MTEVTMAGGLVTAVVVILITTILVIVTKVFPSNRSQDSSDGGGAAVPVISDTPSIVTASSSSGSWKYDVFLSFRGEDTRKTFVDHLYSALQQHGILTYKDDVTLDQGNTIGPSLLKAIEESQIALVIFSENYADSSWCLDELSHIMKCRESERAQLVMPIFYHVDPSDVRKQKVKYREALAKHELSENGKNKVETWTKALFDASNVAGWEPKHVANGHEAKCIKEIVCSILDKLSSLDSTVKDENLVGMETRLEDLKQLLRIGSGGVRMVGIWGLGGGGKTTLAISLYMEFSPNFDCCCFLGNIREETKQHGLQSLQEKVLLAVVGTKMQVESMDIGKYTIKRMLCRRNVLIVLDDVDHLEQLEALAGSHNWFGNGSRIIITTRDEQVLKSHKVDEVCPVSLLSHDEAIRLFKRHAYQEHNPVEDYENLSLRVISYVNGLPLALKILGAFLYGKDKDEWISTLARLKDHPEIDIVEKLKISYDGLKPLEKELFLDIACFLRGEMKDGAMEMLDACGFHPRIGVKVLIQKALISVSKDGKFDMHDLVHEMAHYIVKGEHPNNPEKHSRVWRKEDIEEICSRNATSENDKIEAIQYSTESCSSKFLILVSKMNKLRFLRVTTWYQRDLDEGPGFLSNELRYIEWTDYPARSPFPESFEPRKLVVLKMMDSLQKELWKGCKYLPCLKELELVHARELVRTPDFGGLPCLQKLILRDCGSLEEIHLSLANHKSLVFVEVRDCDKLRRFSRIVGMEKLEILRISHCPALVEFPKIEAKMDNLAELYLDEVGIDLYLSEISCTNLISLGLGCDKLKSIEGNFQALRKLNLSGCGKLKSIEGNFQALIKLDLQGCRNLKSIEGNFQALRNLDLQECRKLKSIEGNFQALRKLDLSGCHLKDGEIPCGIGELLSLQELDLSRNDFTQLDFSLSRLTRLKLLNLSGCRNLVELPELPSSLSILEAVWCWSLKGVIRDEIHTNCKWLSQVSIWGERKNKIGGGERLLKTMLQGNAGVESGCMSLKLQGSEIARGFEPRLVKGGRCGMQLPENWFNEFSGFLFCAATSKYDFGERMEISMKHGEEEEEEEENVGRMGMGDSQHDDFYWEEETVDDDKSNTTWVGYIPFSLLRHTSWWDPTSTAIHIQIDRTNITRCGLKLVPKRGGESSQMETTTTQSSSSEISLDDDDHNYKCKFMIRHDSKSALECSFIFYDLVRAGPGIGRSGRRPRASWRPRFA